MKEQQSLTYAQTHTKTHAQLCGNRIFHALASSGTASFPTWRAGLEPCRAVARYAGLTGSPDESGTRRREKGLSRSGNARVRRGMIQLAWRFLQFQKQSALFRWFERRTTSLSGGRKRMIVALARKLLIALWRLVHDGVIPEGLILQPAAPIA